MDEGVTHLKSTVHTLLHSSTRQTSEPEHQTFEVPVGVQKDWFPAACLTQSVRKLISILGRARIPCLVAEQVNAWWQ